MKRLRYGADLTALVLAAAIVALFGTAATLGQTPNPFAPALVEVGSTVLQRAVPPLGANEFGDIGGTAYTSNNLIPGAGNEPASREEYYRLTAGGADWMEVENMTLWDLIGSGFYSGGSYAVYRIVDAAGNALPEVSGYLDLTKAHHVVKVRSGVIPPRNSLGLPDGGFVVTDTEKRIHLEVAGPELRKWDYAFVSKRWLKYDNIDTHLRVRNDNKYYTAGYGSVWRPWGNDTAVSLELVAHQGTLPADFVAADPGETAQRVVISAAGEHAIGGPAIFYRADPTSGEAKWYGQLEPGKRYSYGTWMKGTGLPANHYVKLTFGQMYTDISRTFQITPEWRWYSFSFVAPERPTTTAWHGSPRLVFSGQGSYDIDNTILSQIDSPADDTKVFVPSKTMVAELLKSQPVSGEKGSVRSMGIMLNESTLGSLLHWYPDAALTVDWYQTVGGHSWSLPRFLSHCLATGGTPATRVKPWLNIATPVTEDDWRKLIEYLSGTVNPNDPSEAARKPWAWLRYRQRGTVTPWTDEFPFISIEFANETWHNGWMRLWRGYGRTNFIHSGGQEFGLFARFWIDAAKRGAPDWGERKLGDKLRFVMGANYSTGYAEIGWPSAQDVAYVGHATYVGPKWETGEAQFTTFDDHGMQATLLGALGLGLNSFADARDAALKRYGRSYTLVAYEGGPGGYYLPGSGHTAEEVEITEKYGKSLGMATAALDAWLLAAKLGWTEQLFLAMGQGEYWSSHTSMMRGYRPHASWLALTLRNRAASGDMVAAEVKSGPAMVWDKQTLPLVGSYAFRNGRSWSVFVLSRKVPGSHDGIDFGSGTTPVTIKLPFAAAETIELFKLAGDPKNNNRDAMNVTLQQQTISPAAFNSAKGVLTVNAESGGAAAGLPAGSIFCYVIKEQGTNPAPPQGLRVR